MIAELRRTGSDYRQRLGVAITALGLPTGPFGSPSTPIPSRSEVKACAPRVSSVPSSLPGISLNVDEQLALVDHIGEYYSDQPFGPDQQQGLRYYFENPFYSYGDGLMLYLMMRHLRPKRIVEVGSGFSSALILDTNERYLDNGARCTFVDPRPERLYSLLSTSDSGSADIISTPVQEVDPGIFAELQASDILFIDSSHVSKIGSDVNFLLFDVLPLLRPGVVIHIHDIFYPFEYPAHWVQRGRAWNEAYLLRALLMFNDEFVIRLFNSYLATFHRPAVTSVLPLWDRNPGGSLWLERVGQRG